MPLLLLVIVSGNLITRFRKMIAMCALISIIICGIQIFQCGIRRMHVSDFTFNEMENRNTVPEYK